MVLKLSAQKTVTLESRIRAILRNHIVDHTYEIDRLEQQLELSIDEASREIAFQINLELKDMTRCRR